MNVVFVLQDGGYGYPPPPARPNLYLYSPSNNTLIPCEEIVIPNPVMNGEGPVYPGPTNIYLAYPVSGKQGCCHDGLSLFLSHTLIHSLPLKLSITLAFDIQC